MHRPAQVEVALHADSAPPGECLDGLLLALGLTSKNVFWLNDTVTFSTWELWRQDDNGNQFLVEKCACRADAVAREKNFTERGHKQFYWTRPSV